MIAKYIMDCLSVQKMIVFSWGFHKPVALINGLQFCVNGFIHKGIVQVIYNEGIDLFEVNTLKNGNVIKSKADVYFDELVEVIDSMVEKNESDENYMKRVSNEYSLI
jgi:hypothetical protein